jgi:hypothetical protein
MGGIPYTLPSSVVDALEYRPRTIVQNIVNSQALVYLTVPIGAVDITPSREELRNTDKTVATVNAMADKFHLALGGWVSDQIAGEPTLIAAMLKHDSLRHNLGWMARLGPSTITWKGIPIPNTMVHTDLDWFALTRKRGGGITARRQENLDVPPGILLSRIMFITGVPEHKLRSVQIAAKEYLTAQDAGDQDRVRTVAALPPGETVFAKEWFTTVDPAVRTMTYDAFIANWKPAQSPSAPRGATRYNLFEDSARTAKELKSETTIYYVTSYDRPNVNPQNDFTRGVVGDAPLVLLRSTQKAHVLVQRLPQAVNLVTVVKKHAEDVLASVTQDDIDALDAEHVLRSVARTMMAWLREIETDITHTGVLAVIDQYDRASNLVDASHDRVLLIHQALRYAGRSQDTLGRSTWDVAAWDRVINTLPLLTSYFRTDWLRSAMGNNHAVSYINMVGDLTGAHTA